MMCAFVKRILKIGSKVLCLIPLVVVLVTSTGNAMLEENIRVAVIAQNAPYQFLEDGIPVGLHIDLLEQIAKQQNWSITYIPMDSSTRCLNALREKRCDIVLGLTENPDEYGVQYTDELSVSTLAMLVTQKTAELLREDPNYVIRSAAYEYNTLKTFQMYGNARVYSWQAVSSQDRAFQALISGDADAVLGVKEGMTYRLRELGIEDEYILYYGNVQTVQFVMAVGADNQILYEKLNEALNDLRVTGKYDSIVKNWITEEYSSQDLLLQFWEKHQATISLAVVGVLGIIITVAIMMVVLRQEVKRKTNQLMRANLALQEQIAYAKQENELRTLMIEHNPNAIFLLNRDYLIVVANQSALRIMASLGDVNGAFATDYSLLQEIMQGKEKALFTDAVSFIDCKCSYQGAHKHIREFQYSVIPLKSGDDVANILIILKDITLELQETERLVVLEKSKMLNQMVAGIAHEIRNPLMSIKTYGQLINLKLDDMDFIRNFASIVPTEVDRINRLLENLINFARQTDPQKEITEIEPLLGNCVRLLHSMMKKAGIRCDLKVQDNMKLLINYDYVHQVVLNVLLNAVQAIEEKQRQGGYVDELPEISCSAWVDSEEAYIQIRDNGVGMDAETLAAVTVPFYTKKTEGTGLGMAISLNYMRANNGTIHMESEYGRFSTITLVFSLETGSVGGAFFEK